MEHTSEIEDLISRALAGDERAQASLVVRFTPAARSAATHLIDERSSVDDVVQDAFAEVFATLDRLREPQAFAAWVRLAVRKHAERHRRRLRRTEPLPPDWPDSVGGLDPDDDLVSQLALSSGIRLALMTAPDADRRLLEWRYLADLSTSELADRLGISEGAVRKRLHDARRRIRPTMSHLIERQELPMSDLTSVLGRVYAPDELDLPDPPPVSRPATREPFATGLKVVDAIAPLARGGTVELAGPAGSGQLVLVVELGQRLARDGSPAAVVAAGSKQPSKGGWSRFHKLVTDLDDLSATSERHAVVMSDDADGAPRALDQARRLAHGLAGEGTEVLLVVDPPTAAAVGGPAALRDLAGISGSGGAVTLLFTDVWGADAEPSPDAGMDTRWVLSAALRDRGLFPAIDPTESRADFADVPMADEVRRLLRTSEEVRRYFKQELVVAEQYTGETPTWVDKATAEDDLRRLVAAAE